MNIDFNVYNYDYDKRDGNLDAFAKSNVKSTKYFPFFYENGKKMIFKPLSKTKPLSTPYFAYSEVVWSTILNNYFDKNIPIYHLARCNGYSNEVPKYHNYGTIVESITDKNEKLFNLYEYFEKYPSKFVNISNYENYCLSFYDYSFFFESELFKQNPDIAKESAKQILYSILRADQNYHYENVSLIEKDSQYTRVALPIDHEFSTMFMYPDNESRHISLFGEYISKFSDEYEQIKRILFGEELEDSKNTIILKNIETIAKEYPDVVEDFIKRIKKLITDLNNNPIILEDKGYIEPFNSRDYAIGQLKYKKNKLEEAEKLMLEIEKNIVPVEEMNKHLNNEILTVASMLNETLQKKLENK